MRKTRQRLAGTLPVQLILAIFLIWIWVSPIHTQAAQYVASANNTHTVGLKSDGTVVAVGSNSDGQCNVDAWTNVAAPKPGTSHNWNRFLNGPCS